MDHKTFFIGPYYRYKDFLIKYSLNMKDVIWINSYKKIMGIRIRKDIDSIVYDYPPDWKPVDCSLAELGDKIRDMTR